MLSPTLQEGLAAYAIGAKIRELRLKKKMGLVELGRHTGLSPALLSKIERSRLFPTLPTLLRIALVFSVDLDYFFAGPREKPIATVVRRSERLQLPDRKDSREAAYRFESLDYPVAERRFSSYLAEFFAVGEEAVRLHDHPGVEFIYVMSGTLVVHRGDDVDRLEAGDATYFDSTVPHGYRRIGSKACHAIVVTT